MQSDFQTPEFSVTTEYGMSFLWCLLARDSVQFLKNFRIVSGDPDNRPAMFGVTVASGPLELQSIQGIPSIAFLVQSQPSLLYSSSRCFLRCLAQD